MGKFTSEGATCLGKEVGQLGRKPYTREQGKYKNKCLDHNIAPSHDKVVEKIMFERYTCSEQLAIEDDNIS